MIQAEPVWEIRSELGEAPLWWEGALYWLDINAPRLYRFTPSTGEKCSYDLAEKTGTVVPTANGSLLLAQQTGLALLDPADQSMRRIAWPAELPIVNRFNDGKCDPQGRLWVGTIGRERPIASLYRVSRDGAVRKMLSGVRVSNGLCWDERLGRFYYIDSPTGGIDAFDWDAERGEISHRRTIARLPAGETGVPDGMTIDTEGRLWVAVFGGFGVHCIDPRSGRSLDKVTLPARNVTACWFGGDKLDELYITTAAINQDEAALRDYPLSGSLFSCRPGAAGHPATPLACRPGFALQGNAQSFAGLAVYSPSSGEV